MAAKKKKPGTATAPPTATIAVSCAPQRTIVELEAPDGLALARVLAALRSEAKRNGVAVEVTERTTFAGRVVRQAATVLRAKA